MIEDFYATSIDEFRNKYLVEQKLDTVRLPKVGGKLAAKATKLNISNAEQLNKWATRIHNRVSSYINREKLKNSEIDINVRDIEMDDWKSQGAAIIVIDVNRTSKIGRRNEVEISIFDNDQVLIRMSNEIAALVNRGKNLKFLNQKDKVPGFVINLLERIL